LLLKQEIISPHVHYSTTDLLLAGDETTKDSWVEDIRTQQMTYIKEHQASLFLCQVDCQLLHWTSAITWYVEFSAMEALHVGANTEEETHLLSRHSSIPQIRRLTSPLAGIVVVRPWKTVALRVGEQDGLEPEVHLNQQIRV